MQKHPTPKLFIVVAGLVAAMTLAGCEKTVSLDLQLVEPCGQDNQALNGVTSYRVLSSGTETTDVAAFNVDQGASGISLGLGEGVIVTVEGYSENITLEDDPTKPTVRPRSVGRTMPLAVTEASQNMDAALMVGKVDSFGAPRALDGTCPTMTADAPVVGRHAHTATFIPGVNKVLLFGGAVWTRNDQGQATESILDTAELYDPATGSFTKLPPLANSRAYHTATALPDGRVLIAGGLGVVNGEIISLINGVVVDVRNTNEPYRPIGLRQQRAHHTATLLSDVGLVALIGGCTGAGAASGCTPDGARGGSTNLTTSVEVIDINKIDDAQFSVPGESLINPRAMHAAVGYNTGNTSIIVISGGLNDTGTLCDLEVLQVSQGALANITVEAGLRGLPDGKCPVRHQMIPYDGDRFVIIGGQTTASGGALNPAAVGSSDVFFCSKTGGVGCDDVPVAQLLAGRYGHGAVKLIDGAILVVGGVTVAGAATSEVLASNPATRAIEARVTTGTLGVARDRGVVTMLGGDSAPAGFVNQVLYTGGHGITAPFITSNGTDIYFGP